MQLETSLRSTKDSSVTPFKGCCAQMASSALSPELQSILNHAATLELEVELLEVQKPGQFEKSVWELSPEERWKLAPITKEEGVKALKGGDIKAALSKFERSVMMLEGLIIGGYSPGGALFEEGQTKFSLDGKQFKSLLKSCRLNYTLCKLKVGDYEAVIKTTSEILKDDPKNIKALFRRGVAFLRVGRDLEKARRDLELCSSEAQDTATKAEINKEMKKLEQAEEAVRKKEKKMWGGLFQ